ncbi:MAG TPA: HAD family phosphatase [Sedimentisphaerales bacterium]|nr:HAD family phosphatase [Sedimentisphaerales bacterium]
MLGAVIFDFDGVITDSEVLHLRAFNRVLEQFGIEITPRDYYKDYLGFIDFDCFEQVSQRNNLSLNKQNIEDLIRQKNRIFEEFAKTEGKIIAGVRDFLGMLKAAQIPMAICSGALLAEIELILADARLRDYFEAIVSAEHVKKGKPHPEGFLKALRRLNEETKKTISAGECVVVEDSRWGLQAAVKAGMHTVAVTNSYHADQLAGAEKIVARLDELSLQDLENLCG